MLHHSHSACCPQAWGVGGPPPRSTTLEDPTHTGDEGSQLMGSPPPVPSAGPWGSGKMLSRNLFTQGSSFALHNCKAVVMCDYLSGYCVFAERWDLCVGGGCYLSLHLQGGGSQGLQTPNEGGHVLGPTLPPGGCSAQPGLTPGGPRNWTPSPPGSSAPPPLLGSDRKRGGQERGRSSFKIFQWHSGQGTRAAGERGTNP